MFVLRSDLRHIYTTEKNRSKLAEKVVQSNHSQPFTQVVFWHSSDKKHVMGPIWNMLLVLYWCTDQCSCELACIFSQKDQRSICISGLERKRWAWTHVCWVLGRQVLMAPVNTQKNTGLDPSNKMRYISFTQVKICSLYQFYRVQTTSSCSVNMSLVFNVVELWKATVSFCRWTLSRNIAYSKNATRHLLCYAF